MSEPDNLVLHLLREMREELKLMRAEMATKDELSKMATKAELADLRSDVQSLRADVAADIHALDHKIDRTRKELSEQIVGVRRAVMEYHSAVVGHGVLIGDLETRVRRLEDHTGLTQA